MTNIALYTYGLLDPDAGPERLADFSRRGAEIFRASGDAPGFLGHADQVHGGAAEHIPGADFGPWGRYALPLGLPDFAGHDPTVHIATLSRWTDIASVRPFVYQGRHGEALRIRYDWFLRGPWPGHVLWRVDDGVVPQWGEGVRQLETLARDGESADRFTFRSHWARV